MIIIFFLFLQNYRLSLEKLSPSFALSLSLLLNQLLRANKTRNKIDRYTYPDD